MCFHHCKLKEDATGLCRARKNRGGKSVAVNYGRLTSLALDPIEKKPLARFYPGSRILSVGSFGCNLRCPFCQNSSISCAGEEAETDEVSPDALAEAALRLRPKGNIGVAFTYNEPMVGYEYVRDAAKAVRGGGMKNVVVTNGSVTEETLGEVLPYIDAYNIDLKGFTREWYEKLGGSLDAVLAFIRLAVSAAHVELTTLVIPGENDSPEEMRELSSWVDSLDKTIPLHITRFFPRHKMTDKRPTDENVLRDLARIAGEKLDTVLLGNV